MPRIFPLLLASCLLSLDSPAQTTARSQIQANDLAAAPAKFEGKTLRVGGRDLAGIKPDGERFTGHAADFPLFPVHLTPGAHAYLTKCRKAGIVPVFLGEVKQAANGKPALFLSRGLNTSR
jgi:hypothetical protein